MINKLCPLCSSPKLTNFSKDKKREYLQCENCSLIFVPSEYHLSMEEEKKRYNLHTNSKDDIYYIDFLKRIVEPVKKYIKAGDKGLDFGCGPGPILKPLFAPSNIELVEYDLYFKNIPELLTQEWNFIITTEVVEHLKAPIIEIKRLWSLIKKDGVLGIMTYIYSSDVKFSSWYYKGDPTHIMFFSKNTFKWLANELNAKIYFFDKDITILIKN